MSTDPSRLLESLARAVGMLGYEPGELEQRLDELVAVAAAIFEVAGAGLMGLAALMASKKRRAKADTRT